MLLRLDSFKKIFLIYFWLCWPLRSCNSRACAVIAHWLNCPSHVGPSWIRDWTRVPCIDRWIPLTTESPGKSQEFWLWLAHQNYLMKTILPTPFHRWENERLRNFLKVMKLESIRSTIFDFCSVLKHLSVSLYKKFWFSKYWVSSSSVIKLMSVISCLWLEW